MNRQRFIRNDVIDSVITESAVSKILFRSLAVLLVLLLQTSFAGAETYIPLDNTASSPELIEESAGIRENYRSGSYRFRDKARELAQNFSRETRSEVDLRVHGNVSYADRNEFQVGEQTIFNMDKTGGDDKKPLPAILKIVGKHCYVYLEKGRRIDEAKLKRVAQIFDQQIYPKTTGAFGSEWKPGVDGDPRITLLLVSGMQGCDGFFYPGDEYTADKQAGSNEREMLYLSTERMSDIDDFMGHLVAHELQHMIHWNNDSGETYWVEEGLAEYAATLFNRMPWTAEQFFQSPDRNLLDWEDTREAENYGHVFLFIDFLLSRPALSEAGQIKLIREIVKSKSAGVKGVVESLARVTTKLTFDEVFRDFCAATFLHDSFNGVQPYRFSPFVNKKLTSYKLNRVMPRRTFKTASGSGKGKVSMWSAAGYAFSMQNRPGKLQLKFSGSTIKSSKGKNVFMLGLALTDSTKKLAPKVLWLKTNANSLEQTINVPAGSHDELLLIVSNQGPVKYLDGDGRLSRVDFEFTLGEGKTRFDTLHEAP